MIQRLFPSIQDLPLACAAVLTIALGCGIASAAHAQAEPGDDFFLYANEAWLEVNAIPTGKARWGARDEIAQRTREQLNKLLDDASSAPRGSDARKVADFRAAILNESVIEARGLAPLKPLLDRIDRIRDKAGLTRFLGSELRADVDPMNLGVYDSPHILGLAVQAGNHGGKDYVAFLLQGGLGLPERESYLDADPRSQARRAEYQAKIERVLRRLAGADSGSASITARADAVLALETALARSHATGEASADEHNADNLWTRADFIRQAPGMDWSAFFTAAGLGRHKTFVAWQPTALKGTAELVASRLVAVWQDYLRVHTVAHYADALPQSLSLEGDAGPAQPGARAQRALDATQAALGEALGKMYVERHFPPESKARVQAIVANVISAFTRRVESAAWMSPAARTTALAKLKALYFGVGYPDRWQDHSSLAIDPADAFGNLRRTARRHYEQAVARLDHRVDRTEWPIAPQWPGAVLTFNENAYSFAAALLQAPKFDPSASDAANYGAIGAIVGHEVSHFVDTLGADYEADGRLHRWWTADDLARYESATAPLVQQFSGYRPFADVAVDGKLGLTENLADLGGLVAAFDAYRGTLGDKANDKEYVRSQDRQFFIGFARSWRVKYRDEALKKQAASDHAPENYRVSTVRNMDAWYDAFDVKPGQRLYLEPKARVRIW